MFQSTTTSLQKMAACAEHSSLAALGDVSCQEHDLYAGDDLGLGILDGMDDTLGSDLCEVFAQLTRLRT